METRRGFSLLELLEFVAVISVLFSIAVPLLSRARRSAWKRDCVGNLRQFGTYVVMYAMKYGSNRDYPPAPGHGFFETMVSVPSPQMAVARGGGGMCSCDVLRWGTNRSIVDYREPGPGLPGGRLRDGVTRPEWPIACDRPTNHDPSGTDDINVLLFAGSVTSAGAGSPEWDMAINYTQ